MLKQVMTGLAVMGLMATAAVAPATAAGKDKPKMAATKTKKAMLCPHCHVAMKNGKCPKCGMTEAEAKKIMGKMHGKKGGKMHGSKMSGGKMKM